jgi:hypothetical protein
MELLKLTRGGTEMFEAAQHRLAGVYSKFA